MKNQLKYFLLNGYQEYEFGMRGGATHKGEDLGNDYHLFDGVRGLASLDTKASDLVMGHPLFLKYSHYTNLIENALKKGAQPTYIDDTYSNDYVYMNALHIACLYLSSSYVRKILESRRSRKTEESGSDAINTKINKKDCTKSPTMLVGKTESLIRFDCHLKGYTPLHLAIRNERINEEERIKMIQLLRKNGAKVNSLTDKYHNKSAISESSSPLINGVEYNAIQLATALYGEYSNIVLYLLPGLETMPPLTTMPPLD